jgi:hypothetical protein
VSTSALIGPKIFLDEGVIATFYLDENRACQVSLRAAMPGNWLEAPVLNPMMKVKLATVFWVMNSQPTVFSSVGWVFTL